MKLNQEERESAGILISLGIQEDVGHGDITTNSLVPEQERRKACMVAKAHGVIAGLEVAQMVFHHFDPRLDWNPRVEDGQEVADGEILVEFAASFRALLTGERTALNFLQRMSGIATMASQYTAELAGTKTVILDTRKTLPGFRLLDKYSVRAGGAANHRTGLYDMVMIKDNHIAVAGGIAPAVESVRTRLGEGVPIEVETTSLEEVRQALIAGADIIMLDNMSEETMQEAVRMIAGKAKTEASGNITLHRLKQIAGTGVDYISAGALTHSVKAFDISQKIYGPDV